METSAISGRLYPLILHDCMLSESEPSHVLGIAYAPINRFLSFCATLAPNHRCMTTTMIPDEDLVAVADVVTLWIATPDAPTDFWSLTEAISWIMGQPHRARITLFRPPAKGLRSAWVKPEQIERLALALLPEAAA